MANVCSIVTEDYLFVISKVLWYPKYLRGSLVKKALLQCDQILNLP